MKKGSISLSINMIVVVVLAFVMLGLMLTLGRQIVEQAGDTAGQVSEQTKQDIINKLSQSDEPLYFNQREYGVNFGDRKTITFGMRNVEPKDKMMKIVISYVDPTTGSPVEMSSNRNADNEVGGAFFWDVGEQFFRAGEGKTFDVQYYAPDDSNSYIFKFELLAADTEAGSSYDLKSTQTIFINVD